MPGRRIQLSLSRAERAGSMEQPSRPAPSANTRVGCADRAFSQSSRSLLR
jgi:hypothetical protein